MRRGVWWAILAFFLSAFLLTVRGHYGSDQFMSYLTAESLVLDQRLAIGVRPFTLPDIQTNLQDAPVGADGQRYSLYGLALPLAMTPFYLAGHLVAHALPAALHDYVTMFFVSATNAVVTALTCLMLVAYSLRLGYAPRTGFALAVLYGFGTMAWNYSQYSFAEPLFAALLLASLLVLEGWDHSPAPGLGQALLLGILLGLCLLTEDYAALIAVPALGVYLAWRLWRSGAAPRAALAQLTAVAAGALPSVLAILWFYQLRFGGHGVPRLSGSLSLIFAPIGLYGLIFSSGKSFFLYVPAALLGLLGAAEFWRRRRGLAALLAGIAIASTLFISTYVDFWHGDAAWGPRFLFHLAFIAVLPAGLVLERAPSAARWKQVALAGLVGLSGLVQLGGVLVNLGKYIQMVTDQQLGDQHFLPQLSPVIGHWLLVASTIKQLLTEQSLVVGYPTGQIEAPWRLVDLEPYGGFDLWFTNLPHYWHSAAAPVLAVAGAIGLLAVALASLAYVWPRLPAPDRRAGQAAWPP
jgi:hypothetical protein